MKQRTFFIGAVMKEPTDLYFIETQCPERFVKIGIASDVKTRMSKMQMDCPYKLKLLWLAPGMASLERELHQRFAADRVTGEWFRRSQEMLDFAFSIQGRDTVKIPDPPYVWEPPPPYNLDQLDGQPSFSE